MPPKAGQAGRKHHSSQLDLQHAQALLVGLKQGHAISDDELLQAIDTSFTACPDPYDKACKLRKDNPNCFCGFIPGPGAFRRKGLWQKEPGRLSTLGADPSDSKREVSKSCCRCLGTPVRECRSFPALWLHEVGAGRPHRSYR